MPDGSWWTAQFQHERAQLMRRDRERERRLFLFFRDAHGALRRATVPESLKSDATDAALRNAWLDSVLISESNATG